MISATSLHKNTLLEHIPGLYTLKLPIDLGVLVPISTISVSLRAGLVT